MVAGWLDILGWMIRSLAARLALEGTIFARCVLLSLSCVWSKLAVLAAVLYYYWPNDLIPDRIPYYGHLDDACFIVLGLILARRLVPEPLVSPIRARHPMPEGTPERVIVFCHCPKTAGTSVFRAISDRLGYRHAYLMRRQPPDLGRLRQAGFTLVSGHAPYGHYVESGDVDERTRFITFFREPRAVLLSHFAHVYRNRAEIPAAHHFFDVELPGLGHAPTSPEAVRLFLGRFREFDGRDVDNPQVRFAANRMEGPLDERDLETAKRSFAAMAAVGCTERFEESLVLIADRFGWDSLPYQRLNVSVRRQKAEEAPELLAELDRYLVLDHALIDWAKRDFDAAITEMTLRHRASGRALPAIERTEAEPYRFWTHRLAAAATLLPDDWAWWLGRRVAQIRRRIDA